MALNAEGSCGRASAQSERILPGRCLGKDDRLVTWKKPAQRPDAWGREAWEALPESLSLRLIRLDVGTPAFLMAVS